jgi:hypothetical protein
MRSKEIDTGGEERREKVCSGRDLAAVLARASVPSDEARAWYRELQTARGRLKPPDHTAVNRGR